MRKVRPSVPLRIYNRSNGTKNGKFNSSEIEEVVSLFKNRTSIENIGKMVNKSKDTIRNILRNDVLNREIEYVDSPEFKRKNADKKILAPMPEDRSPYKNKKLLKGTHPFLASISPISVLSRSQQMHLFRQMNYLLYKANSLQKKLRSKKIPIKTKELRRIEECISQASEIRSKLVETNIKLVPGIAGDKRNIDGQFEMNISQACYTLMNAAIHFDYMRGNSFATYAVWSMTKEVYWAKRRNIKKQKGLGHFEDGNESLVPEYDEKEMRMINKQADNRSLVRQLINNCLMSRRAKVIVSARYGLDGDSPEKLKDLGERFGLSYERIRQIQEEGIDDLREFAEKNGIEWTEK